MWFGGEVGSGREVGAGEDNAESDPPLHTHSVDAIREQPCEPLTLTEPLVYTTLYAMGEQRGR